MSRSVWNFLSTLIGADRTRVIAQRIDVLSQWGHQVHRKILAHNVRLERPDPRVWLRESSMRAVVAFILSYALVFTVGTMILPDTGRKLKPRPSTSQAAVAPSRDVLPGLPSLVAPRVDGPLRHTLARDTSLGNRPTDLDSQRERPASQAGSGELSAPAAVSLGLRQTPAAARPNGSPRGVVAKVTGITVWGTPSRPWVSIAASGPVRYQLRNVEPDWVVVDVSRAQLALAPGMPPAGRGLVRQIRVGQFAQDIVRVVLELTQSIPIHVAVTPDKTTIIVSLAAAARGNGGVLPPPALGAHAFRDRSAHRQ
jgi:AMIN domain